MNNEVEHGMEKLPISDCERLLGAGGVGILALPGVDAPILRPVNFALLERLGIPFAPAELFDLMRFGHAVDIRKLERAGWKPRFDQAASLGQFTR